MLRNTIKDHWTRERLPIGSFVRAGGMEIRYEATESSSIDVERVMELYENEEINRDQFLRMLKVSVSEAKNVLGGDQVADFTITEVGKKLDIRLEDLPVEKIDEEFVMENSNVRKRVKRRVFGGVNTKPAARAPSGKPKRRIKTRASK